MELIVYAPVWGQSGMERVSRELLMALDQIGVHIELRPDYSWNAERIALRPHILSRLNRMMRYKANSLAPHVIHQLPKGQNVNKNAPLVCYTLFETDRCPTPWIHSLNRMDKVFVFSEFNRKSWSETGIIPEKISALPPAVDSHIYNPQGPKMQIKNKKGFTFLCSGDFTERKNFEAVIEAYVTEFTDKDPVTLIFKCHYGGFTKKHRADCLNRIRQFANHFNPNNPPNILFWGDKISDFAMASLYRSVDCFVLTSRGEGLGMQYLEAMASGVPVIACDWGAQMDYLSGRNSFLVKSALKVIDDANYISKCPQAINGKWCQVSIQDLKETMRYVHDNYAAAKKKAEVALEDVREFTWQKMAIAFVQGIITMYESKKNPAAAPQEVMA